MTLTPAGTFFSPALLLINEPTPQDSIPRRKYVMDPPEPFSRETPLFSSHCAFRVPNNNGRLWARRHGSVLGGRPTAVGQKSVLGDEGGFESLFSIVNSFATVSCRARGCVRGMHAGCLLGIRKVLPVMSVQASKDGSCKVGRSHARERERERNTWLGSPSLFHSSLSTC